MNNNKLRFFVFEGILEDYTSGMACAAAYTPEEAVFQVARDLERPDYIDELTRACKEITEPSSFHVYGGG